MMKEQNIYDESNRISEIDPTIDWTEVVSNLFDCIRWSTSNGGNVNCYDNKWLIDTIFDIFQRRKTQPLMYLEIF